MLSNTSAPLPAPRPRNSAPNPTTTHNEELPLLKRMIATAFGLLLLSALSAEAQYFGRNKVQYDRFEFAILETAHFDVYYYPEEQEAAQIAARMAERWYERLSSALDHTFDRRQPIILYASHAHFAQTSILPGYVPEGVGGFTDHLAGRVVLPFAAGLGETDHVLGHEIVHAFQRDILRKQGSPLGTLPLWFSEGMAEYLSVGDLDANTRMWLRDAAASKHVPSIPQLRDPKWFPYRYGQALWLSLADKYGADVVVRALAARKARNAIARLEIATGHPEKELTAVWREYVTRTAIEAAAASSGELPRVIGGAKRDGRLNIGPSLSPDGRYLVFMSERDRHAVDVFLADAATGKVVRTLTRTATDPHFDALQFIESAGAWDSSSRSFVMATISDGHPVLTIFDMPSGRIARRVTVTEVDQVFTPTWSPDGTHIAFSGMKGGVTDIYTIDLADSRVQALTNDVYSDLQPSWSPDGTEIAFTSDRFSSSIDRLDFGRYALGVIALPSATISSLGGTAAGKSIDPHWCADGECIYFVSDASGVSNVYRLDRASLGVTRMTSVPIGVSGITALSPAISVGSEGTRVAMSLYTHGAFEIHTLDVHGTDGTPVVPRAVAASDKPVRTASAAPAAQFNQRPYSPKLSLFSFGQPYLSAGGGAFGSYFRAGVAFGVGDMFGEQELDTAVQVGKKVSDLAIETTYLNRRSRWNWGVTGAQVPWFVGSGFATRATVGTDGRPVMQRDAILERQQHRQLSGIAIYPFSRARRIEMSAGIDAVRFSREVTTTTFAGDTLRRIDESTTTVPSGRPATSFVTAAAFVHDTAVFGPTSPIMGTRYRASVGTSVGGLMVTTLSGDYRRYFAPTDRFSIATRVEQVARVGRDVTDPRLLPLVWSPREVVRGYTRDAVAEHASRLLVGNIELRMPLANVIGRGASDRLLPVELFAFSDWARFSAPSTPSLSSTARQLWSSGAGARLNAAGFVFEFNAARTLVPLAGWHFVVNFRPGF
jgi:Tol biopolymer transport system component